jgi:hypothetical protein
VPGSTRRFPEPEGSQFEASLFETCLNPGDEDCCPFGTRECTQAKTIRLERLDGMIYPPVVVHYRLVADAEISTCPLGEGQPGLETRLVEP